MNCVCADGLDEAAGLQAEVEAFVLQVACDRVSVVATSRPEGVTLENYASSFVVFDLEPLNDEQQLAAIGAQIGEQNAFFQHLMAFTRIRKEHDRIYHEVAFPSADDRRRIEGFCAPNKLLLEDGKTRDGARRQRTRDDSAFIHVSHQAPQSTYLLDLQPFFSTKLLRAFDDMLISELAFSADAANEEDVQKCVVRLPDEDVKALVSIHGNDIFARERNDSVIRETLAGNATFQRMGLAVKLGLLVLQRHAMLHEPCKSSPAAMLDQLRAAAPQTTASALWPAIVARTDAIFVAVEDLLPVFKRVLEQLASTLSADGGIVLRFGELKDPVRIHEKGLSDYSRDFDDFHDDTVIAEACVLDVLRARAVCPSGELMLRMQEALRSGFEVQVDGCLARVELLRSKSKFAKHALDPTRFRNILNNLTLTHGDRRTYAELQVQQRDILAFNDAAHAHDHYNYFRSLLADTYTTDLNAMLERTILFLEEVSGVPVLLSMLVLIFDSSGPAARLPTNRYELYEQAMRCVLKKRSGDEHEALLVLLRAVAMANLDANARREFNSEDCANVLDEAQRSLWWRLWEEARGVPLVKMLMAPAAGMEGQYQFRHLSLQEALCAQALATDEACRRVMPWGGR